MKMLRNSSALLMFVQFYCSGSTINTSEVQQVATSSYFFNHLYPKDWYAHAIENCVNVWGSLEQLQQCTMPLTEQIVDISLGRLLFAHYCIKQIQKSKQIHAEHIAYLARVIGTLEYYFNSLQDDSHEKLECFKERIQKIKEQVRGLLSF